MRSGRLEIELLIYGYMNIWKDSLVEGLVFTHKILRPFLAIIKQLLVDWIVLD